MWFKRTSSKIEKYTTDATDQLARQVSRREGLKRALAGATTLIAGVAVGQFAGAKSAAAAVDCPCAPPRGVYCSGCPTNGCPSGHVICKTSHGCDPCIYSDGYWVSCTGLGSCGGGFRLCYDCKKSSGTCSTTCGCRTGILCSGCCTADEVKAEMARVQQEAAAA
ncbi:hypothetical protein [Nonomuraea typhae]|uniref:hypothetical protein n=1 Tax=Nonomuraea typhae TaxID=2603600 RepID=UPI0012F9E8E6|nr:hypothetical protein [Nonomuraea typhae]